jgi:large subunit ribosomal protein L18
MAALDLRPHSLACWPVRHATLAASLPSLPYVLMRGQRNHEARVMTVLTKEDRRLKRRRRVRAKISGTAQRPRISVFRSNRGICAQLIDDSSGNTLAAVNWFEADLRKLAKGERTKRAAQTLAERAKAAGISEAVFDRGGYQYHGHVRAFAEAIREAGITV